MKKNSRVFVFTTLIAVILLYVVSAIFTLGTVFMPATALVTSTNPQRGATYLNSYANVDIVRTRPDPENEDKTFVADVSNIYVFVGEVRSYAVDDEKNAYIEIHFQFKPTNESDAGKIYREEVAKIPVKELSGGFKWIEVFNAEDAEKSAISYSRVKICTPDSIDLYEVVFTDETGYVFDTKAVFGAQEQIDEAKMLIDEQNMFKYSQSKKYNFTDKELKNLSAVNALRGGKVAISESPLTTILQLVGVSIFGTNTFGLRFFDCLAGLGMLLLAYAFAVKMFGEEKYGIIVLLSVLSLGAVFTASNFAFGGVGAFFAVLSTYLASRYFVKHYYLDSVSDAVWCLLGIGLSFGLAVACDTAYALTIIGLIVLFAMARSRAYKQYKREEKEAKGLEKEEVFLAYRKKNLISLTTAIISLLVIPAIIFVVLFAPCAKVYTTYYEVGFMASLFKCFVEGITPSYQSFPLSLFVGFGGISVNGFHSFLNYFTSILALACFAFVTIVVFFGKKIPFFSKVKSSKNKYKITTVAFLSLCLPVFLGLTSSPYGFAGVSVFMCAYIAFAYSILVKCFKKNVVALAFNVATCVGLVVFGMAYVGYVGFVLPEVANKILYFWQVL